MKLFLRVFLLFVIFIPTSVFALNVQNHRYYFQTGRADTLIESKPKPMDTLSLGLGMSYALQPFEFGSSAGALTPRSIVDHLFTFDLGASYSFTDRMALAVNLPMHITSNIKSLSNLNQETVMSLGDIGVAGLYNVIQPDSNDMGFGFSVTPFLSFPTGVNDNFIGDTNMTGGFLLVSDVDVNGSYFGFNVGLRFRENENFLNLKVGQELLYNFAYAHDLWQEQKLDFFAELGGSTVLEDFFQKQNSSPAELKLGLSKSVFSEMPVQIKLVNGFGLGNGYGNPDYRVTLNVAFDHSLPRTQVQIVEKTVTVERVARVEQELKDLTIYYPTNGAQVDPFYDQKIAGIAAVMKNNPDMGPLYIIGHTDNVGSDAFNRKLSEKRARQAYDSIVQHGLLPKQIIWFGLGEAHPVAQNDSDSSRALNRRTIFTFQKPSQLMEAGSRYVNPTSAVGQHADSYTEVLKQKQDAGFVDDAGTLQNKPVQEDVQIHEKTVVKDVSDIKPAKQKKEKVEKTKVRVENTAPAEEQNTPDVQDNSENKDNFEEGFSE